ncbi:hypothetical protein [Ignicoccus hospitalis]|uniref:Uncharacterized protein n=1 Tax=Ignicoccus hospitalis (strain KIN4/I / DSM 18386 / JCM 14125) TaxID=453591 RepID=A8AAF6_IGNH4|nr:hypothetical protein [Ignicoccus hospitalis]ABU81908.1 hypothetical protein Igni_0726 [Ignicoccus hospitalis KIN4/I]HIH89934.1 hypothetical protein [Desulfurococcaceae archaeon]
MEDRAFYLLLRKFREFGVDPSCARRVSCRSELDCIIKALKICNGLKVTQLGIDPGETVGIVIVVDAVPVWEWEGSRDEAVKVVSEVLKTIEIDRVVTSEGGLDLLPSSLEVPVVLVREHGTSKRRVRGLKKHSSSAYLMVARNSITRRVRRWRGGS